MPYSGPVPPIAANPYGPSQPAGAVVGPAAVGFDGWALGLATAEGQLKDLGPTLAGIEANRASMVGPLGQAVSDYGSNPIQGAMTQLRPELDQPNPLGTKVPYEFKLDQLPSPTSPTTGLDNWLGQNMAGYLQQLWQYLSSWTITPPPPIPRG